MRVDETGVSKDGIRRLLVKEFRAQGYLQELNRKFLHPLGLALEVIIDPSTEEEYFGGVLDYRQDDYGIVFGMKTDKEKAERIEKERVTKLGVRKGKFGWGVQPVGSVVNKADCK